MKRMKQKNETKNANFIRSHGNAIESLFLHLSSTPTRHRAINQCIHCGQATINNTTCGRDTHQA